MLLDDTIVDTEDVSKFLGLSVLASVPAREGEEESKQEEIHSGSSSASSSSSRKTSGGVSRAAKT
ncbi:MAG: hypothetical protein II786_04215, partial [Muribaculaceae bacterium]|nr:hypothetical protein [Muribaculaceae bacterium]